MLYVQIPAKNNMYGIIQATGFPNIPPELDSLPALYARLKQKFARYRTLDERVDRDALILRQALLAGELKEAQPSQRVGNINRVHRPFFQDLFAINKKVATSSQTLGFEYFAVGNKYNVDNFTDTQLGNEIYRRTPDTINEDGASSIYATTLLSVSQGNPTLATTVVSSTASVITVASATGAILTGRIQVVTANNTYFCTITAIAGNDLTVGAIMDLGGTSYADFSVAGDIPASPNPVNGIHCEAALITRDDATPTLGSGLTINRRIFEFSKQTGLVAQSVLYDVIFSYVSVD